MWGWADPLVETATKAVYEKVFTAFGAVTLSIVGLYLVWRSSQADLSNAVTTAGWAIFRHGLDQRHCGMAEPLCGARGQNASSSLGVIHDAVGPSESRLPIVPQP